MSGDFEGGGMNLPLVNSEDEVDEDGEEDGGANDYGTVYFVCVRS